MNRQNVIVVIAPTLEVWGNLKKLCESKGFDVLPYHSLKSKPFPIIHNSRLPFLMGDIYFNNSKVVANDAKTESLKTKYEGTAFMALV